MATYYAKEVYSTFAETNNKSNDPSEWYECWVQGSEDYWYRTFLKYDLSGIPYKSRITSAKLRLYESWKNDNGDNGTTNIARVTQDWVDSEVNWNNMPATEGTYLSESVSPPGVGSWSDWDITALVQEWVDQAHPNYGLMIVNNNEGEYRVDWKFYNRHYNSGEYATYIEIEYEPEPEVRITQARLTEIAEQVRRIAGMGDTLTPSQIVTALAGVGA